MSFLVQSDRIYGLGEKYDSDDRLELSPGIYVLYPYIKKEDAVKLNKQMNQVDDQPKAKVLAHMNPFLMMQLKNGKFIGMFLFNSNAMEIEIIAGQLSTSTITFRTTGGIFDFFFFSGPTYENVIRQYQTVIGGMPVLPPAWVSGFISRSPLFSDGDKALAALSAFKKARFPVQGLALTTDSFSGHHNFDYQPTVSKIRTEYSDINLILPFTYFVPKDSTQYELDALLKPTEGTSLAV